ncbi:MAG: Rieske 2Fe-2S domain-containing protein [Pirellulales bacterium]|nr:Rieske 2Fe-2S domain-containing protein [Pirellulales bacterium]
MGFFSRLFGICKTKPPKDAGCWAVREGRIEIDLDRAAELETPGGAFRLEGDALPQRVLVIRGDDDQYHAFPNRCTHVGHRRLDPLPGKGKIRCCSIGQSEFDYAGARLSGAATDSLQPLAVRVEGRTLIVTLEDR